MLGEIEIVLDYKLRVRLKCPKHRYNPVKDGLGFHSACPFCTDLYRIYQSLMGLERTVRLASSEVEEFKKRQGEKL